MSDPAATEDTAYREIGVTPLSPAVGAEIAGVDLANPLADAQLAEIRRALGEHGVIFFRRQEISPAAHLAFAERWGEINVNRFFTPVAGFPGIAEVRREPADPKTTGYYWHTDHSYDAVPAMGSVFVARELPAVGGDTLFAGVAAAYAALSDGLKAVLEGLEAWHSSAQAPELYDPEVRAQFAERLKELEGVEVRARHPVVIRHPISGRKVLYVNPGFTEGFIGWSSAESRALLNYLYEHVGQPVFTYRHRWQAGDIAFWDNRATWHCALDDCFGYRRVLHRITIEGEPLTAAASA